STRRMVRGFAFETDFIREQLGMSIAIPRIDPADPKKLPLGLDWLDSKGRRYTSGYSLEFPTPEFIWKRINLDAIDGTDSHAIHLATHGRVLVVVHYRFLQKDRKALLDKAELVPASFVERAFMARSIALY